MLYEQPRIDYPTDDLGPPPPPWEYPKVDPALVAPRISAPPRANLPKYSNLTVPVDPKLLDNATWYAPLTYGGVLHV